MNYEEYLTETMAYVAEEIKKVVEEKTPHGNEESITE